MHGWALGAHDPVTEYCYIIDKKYYSNYLGVGVSMHGCVIVIAICNNSNCTMCDAVIDGVEGVLFYILTALKSQHFFLPNI